MQAACTADFNLHCSVFRAQASLDAPLAQLVEQLTLNQWVLGSNPRRRTKQKALSPLSRGDNDAAWSQKLLTRPRESVKRPVGQAVKTAASHAANRSSILLRVTNF